MIREIISDKGNCRILKAYKDYDNGAYYLSIFREHGITGERIFETESCCDSLIELLRVAGQWERYYKSM